MKFKTNPEVKDTKFDKMLSATHETIRKQGSPSRKDSKRATTKINKIFRRLKSFLLDQKPYNQKKIYYAIYSMKYNFVIIGTIDDGFESNDAALDFLERNS